MYSSVASLHIALDARIQQQNSNRKLAIFPQQYDMVLNDAIQTVLRLRLSARLNPIQIGFEQSTNNYDSLKSLKRTYIPTCYFDSVTQRFYFELPSNYYMYDTLISGIDYKRNNTTITTENVTLYTSRFNFEAFITANKVESNLIYKDTALTSITPRNIYQVGISRKSSFYYFNLIKDYFKSEKNIDCFYENYNNNYYRETLIFVSETNNIPVTVYKDTTIVPSNSIVVTSQNITLKKPLPISGSISLGNKKLDLVSSIDNANDNNDYYAKSNIHLNPKFTMENNKVFLTTSSEFRYNGLRLEYIKQPRIIDSTIGQMTDMEITDDILDIATKLFISTINNEQPSQSQQK